MLRLLAPIFLAFKVWMFIDAIRRKAETHWFWIIMVVPLGDVAYFFAVKIRDPSMRRMAERMLEGFKRPPPIEELEERFRVTPSMQNRVMLAQGLFDEGRFAESLAHFEQILEREADSKEGLYGLGSCRLELGDAAGAVEPLSRLLDMHRGYRDYAAWPALVEALWRNDQRDQCLALLVDLVRAAPRLRHQLLRARYLARARRRTEAEEVLHAALRDHERAPRYQRREERPWAKSARALLEELARPAT